MIEYGTSLYRDTDVYICHTYKTHEEWLKGRHTLHGIGGSDAAAALGKSHWRTNLELWMIKTGRKEQEDISDSESVQTGVLEEEPIRRIFQAEMRNKYEVQYVADAILQNREHPEMLYSPDGLLIDKETGRKGILEIKTGMYRRETWGTKEAPFLQDQYYMQILHGMNVTGFDFVELFARLQYPDGEIFIRPVGTYHLDRDEEGIEYELKAEQDGVLKFMEYVKTDKEPDMNLNMNF